MKKIIAIMGSPRKNGNTHLLLSRMIEGVQEAGGTGEIISLVDYKIYDCDGCHTCWKGNACSKNDDMNGLYLKINECDVIIFGTPVYWYGPTAIMKAFLDRFVYYNCPENRQLLKGKSAILVTPFEEKKEETARLLVEMFKKSLNYLEIPLIEKLIVPGVYHKADVLKFDAVMKNAYKIGTKIINLLD